MRPCARRPSARWGGNRLRRAARWTLSDWQQQNRYEIYQNGSTVIHRYDPQRRACVSPVPARHRWLPDWPMEHLSQVTTAVATGCQQRCFRPATGRRSGCLAATSGRSNPVTVVAVLQLRHTASTRAFRNSTAVSPCMNCVSIFGNCMPDILFLQGYRKASTGPRRRFIHWPQIPQHQYLARIARSSFRLWQQCSV